jgi:uncharacterized protein YbjT (DUF2867 family)
MALLEVPSMRAVLVTGATGTIGRAVVSELLAAGARVRAMTRSPGAADLPPGAEVVRGDLTAPASLDGCLEGVDVVFLVWTAPAEAATAAVALMAGRARRVVLLSSPHRTEHPLFQQPNPVSALHAEVERLVEASGLGWTFLRPGMFAANARAWWAEQVRGGDVVRWPFADAPSAPVHEGDVAAVAARALLEDGYDRAEYVLTGPESLTHREQVAVIGDVIGRPLRYEEMSPEEARREWPGPAAAVDMLLRAWAAAVGRPALVTTTVAEVTGRPARTFRAWVAEHAAQFRA